MVARLGIVLLVIILALGAYSWVRVQSLDEPLGHGDQSVTVEIKPGMGFNRIVTTLGEAGVLKDPLVFKLYVKWVKADRGIKAGTYVIDLGWTPKRLITALREGTLPAQTRVTIPEGYNRWQIADLLSKKGLIDRVRFLRAVERDNLEGRLFPETYFFGSDATTDEVIARLTGQFDKELKAVLGGKTVTDLNRFINLASLVEKESKHPLDQKKVARVFENRIARKMKLQTDPTCVYGESLYTKVPHPRYCKDPNSRYSTYVIKGLPPTAIANPGRTAMAAVLAPYDGPNADKLLFFVAKRDGTGTHHFSTTYAEHNRAVDRYLRKKKK